MKKFEGVVKYFESRGDYFVFCISPGLWEFELHKMHFEKGYPEILVGRKARVWCNAERGIYEVEVEEQRLDLKFAHPWIVFWPAKKHLVPITSEWRNKLTKQTKDRLVGLASQLVPTFNALLKDCFFDTDYDKLKAQMFLWAMSEENKVVQALLSDLVELAPGFFSNLAYQIKTVPDSEIRESVQRTRGTFEEDFHTPDLYNLFKLVARAGRFRPPYE